MYDVTEGGVLGAISEMAEASGCGFRVEDHKIPSSVAPRRIAQLFKFDHRLSFGAGSMIMAVKPGSEQRLIRHLQNHSIPATAVGRMTAPAAGRQIVGKGEGDGLGFDGIGPLVNGQ